MVIGMDRFLRSHLAASDFNGAVRNDLIHVHVGLRAAARLPYAQGKLVIQFARNYLVGSLYDQFRLVGRQFAQVLIYFFSSRRRHTRYIGDWSSDVCSSDLNEARAASEEMRASLARMS